MKKIVALSILALCLTTSQAHAGKIKKALLGVTLVGIGVGATILYKKGQENERAKWLAEKGVEFKSENNEEIERLKQLSQDMWAELKNGIPIDEDLRHIANDLRRSTSISVLDTSAFTFAEMGDRKTALEIYEYRIFPMLQEQDDASISKYEKHYAILQSCVPRSCMKELYNIL